MKGSSGYSASTATEAASGARPAARPSRLAPPSRAAESFALAGPSAPPDPAKHAYRKDLADIALAGRVIASHYAEPLLRHLIAAAPLKAERSDDSTTLTELSIGDEVQMLDCSLGWAWGYAGPDRLVGYIRQDAVAA